ncbi:hypothetical protein AAFO92_06185 [Roseovarius sp. CAU 1744]|uniref:hypothetical protein n=1 Tax=Roseovarius sp. CAU 1744 TaxID=3140368 RepID=UPI00325ABB97
MFGVVLWSDQVRNRAVIWCEDHGDLAFFNGDGSAGIENAEMEPGDLVQFDVRADRNMRLASKPRLVSSDEYPTLARDLKQAGKLPEAAATADAASSKIVAFEPKLAKPAPATGKVRRVI